MNDGAVEHGISSVQGEGYVTRCQLSSLSRSVPATAVAGCRTPTEAVHRLSRFATTSRDGVFEELATATEREEREEEDEGIRRWPYALRQRIDPMAFYDEEGFVQRQTCAKIPTTFFFDSRS